MKVKDVIFENLANAITCLRLILSAWLIILAIYGNQLFLMFVLALLCIVSDYLDGKVARLFGIESRAGSILDRLADKVFIVPTIVILALRYWPNNISLALQILTGSLVAVVVLLETLLLISGVFGVVKGLEISANRWGKRKMAFSCTAVFLWFCSLVVEKYFRIKVFYASVILIDLILLAVVFLTIKSIEGYFERWKTL